MKKLYRISLGVLAAGFAMGVSQNASALGTAAATVIGNTAIVSGGNFSVANSSVNVTVGTQLGARASSEVDQGTATGVYVTNTVRVTNYGNVTADFDFRFGLGQTNKGGPGWTNGFGATFTATAAAAAVAPGAIGSADFRVYVPALASNAAARSYTIKASNKYTGASAILTNYVGDNTTNYGGDLGDFVAGARNVWIGGATGTTLSNTTVPVTANRVWSVTVSAAVVSITKTASITNSKGITSPVPGSTVRYRIAVTNIGSSGATGVEIRDNRPANTAYIAGSLKGGVGTAIGYAAAGALTDANTDDAGAASATYVEFTPNVATADATQGNGGGGTLATTDGRSYFFRVTIN